MEILIDPTVVKLQHPNIAIIVYNGGVVGRNGMFASWHPSLY